MNKHTILTAILVSICSTFVTTDANAQSFIDKLFRRNTDTIAQVHPELTELTVAENLLIPELTDKQASQARKIQAKEADRLKAATKHIAVELVRDEEVIKVTIAASQLFAPNGTQLLDGSDAILRTLLPCLRTPDYYHVLLVMHSDNTGNEDYNYALTTERVFAVYDWFESNGGCVEYVVPYAAGSFEPVKPNNTVTGRNANRRLEIYIIPAEKMFAKK